MNNPDKCELTDPFELYGKWWRSGSDREMSVSGCLSYTPDHGLQLQLYGELPGETLLSLRGHLLDQPIWGEVSGFAGKQVKVSLFDEIPTNQPNDPTIEGKPSSHTIYYINRAIAGTHASSLGSLRLSSVRFSLADFETFFNTKHPAPYFDDDATKLDYVPDKPLELAISDPSMRATVETFVGVSGSLPARNCVITYRTEMHLNPVTSIPFEDGIEMVFSLTNLFLLCARESVTLRDIRGVLDTGETIQSFGLIRRCKVRWSAKDWVLTLRHMDGRFEAVLNRWFALVKKLGFMGHVLFSELADPSRVQDARFFHFAGCLEAFHREVVQREMGKFLPRAEYKSITKSLLRHLPTDLPEGLDSSMRIKLSQANDHAFAERINALFNSLDPETQRCLTGEPERFLAAIKHSRNKLAHISDGSDHETFEGEEYAHANVSLQAWLTILLLKECGVAESVIRDRMRGIGYFYWGPFQFEREGTKTKE